LTGKSYQPGAGFLGVLFGKVQNITITSKEKKKVGECKGNLTIIQGTC